MPNQQNDKPKVVLITGAARRIGAEIARYFHSNNYNIIIHYNNSEKEAIILETELNNIRANSARITQCDLENIVSPDFANSFIKKIIGFYGQVNTLVNNASSFFPTKMGSIDLAQWKNLMISNAGGPFFLSQSLSKYLSDINGSIINISDIHAVRPLKGYPVYSIAKAANDMVTKSLARELAPNVRVNSVAPGPVLWPEDKNELDKDLKNKIIEKTLLKKTGSPEDIAKAVFFLAESQYITGQILSVDGGRSLRD